MTREEVKERLKSILETGISDDEVLLFTEDYEAIDIAIKTLERKPSEDCISRQAVISIIDCHKNMDGNDAIVWIEKETEDLPSVTPQPKTGRWILADEQNKEDVENDNYCFICSECQHSDIHAGGVAVLYCWHCGAKMTYVPDTNVGEITADSSSDSSTDSSIESTTTIEDSTSEGGDSY